jgi:hypothetical protein
MTMRRSSRPSSSRPTWSPRPPEPPAPANGNGHGNGKGNGAAHAPDTNGAHHEHGAASGDPQAHAGNGDTLRAPARKSGRAPANGHAAVRAPVRPHDGDAATDRPVVAKPVKLSGDVIAAATEIIRQRNSAAHTHEGLHLERIDVERRGTTLRCRTVLSLNGRTYAAIAETPDTPSAEAELAARVAVDALRAGGLTAAALEGVGFITIADVNYCVATVRESGSKAHRAGAAPLIDSMAASATAAVLTALGPFTDARAQSRARAGN